jgi:hypothetical protein
MISRIRRDRLGSLSRSTSSLDYTVPPGVAGSENSTWSAKARCTGQEELGFGQPDRERAPFFGLVESVVVAG